MNYDKEQIKIAEFCGWENITTHEAYGHKTNYGWHPTAPVHDKAELPDYFGDLNAMYEAEKQGIKIIGRSFWIRYSDELENVRKAQRGKTLRQWHTTAKQRAKAFLRVIDSVNAY